MNRISDDVIERIIDFYLGDISERDGFGEMGEGDSGARAML